MCMLYPVYLHIDASCVFISHDAEEAIPSV
jgi:hypothetical protein